MYQALCQQGSKSNFKYFGHNEYLRKQVNTKFRICDFDVKILFRYKIIILYLRQTMKGDLQRKLDKDV
jgi:hypothetical protein